MRSARGFALFELVILVTVVIIIGTGAFLWKNKEKNNITPSTTPTVLPSPSPITELQEYHDDASGYSLQYPSSWKERFSESGGPAFGEARETGDLDPGYRIQVIDPGHIEPRGRLEDTYKILHGTLLSRTEFTVDGHRAVKLKYTYPNNDDIHVDVIIYDVKLPDFYVQQSGDMTPGEMMVMVADDPARVELYDSTFDQIVDSIKLPK